MFYWSVIGWGIGLAFHGMGVFSSGSPAVAAWEKRKIKELMDAMEHAESRPDQK